MTPREFNPQQQDYYLPGDVVAVVEDDVFLGADIERGYPIEREGSGEIWWRIISVPDAPAADAVYLLERDDPQGDGSYATVNGYATWKRKRHLDLTALAGRGDLDNVVIDVAADLLSYTVDKEPMP